MESIPNLVRFLIKSIKSNLEEPDTLIAHRWTKVVRDLGIFSFSYKATLKLGAPLTLSINRKDAT